MPEKEEGHCRSSKAQQDWRQGETDLEMAAPHWGEQNWYNIVLGST